MSTVLGVQPLKKSAFYCCVLLWWMRRVREQTVRSSSLQCRLLVVL